MSSPLLHVAGKELLVSGATKMSARLVTTAAKPISSKATCQGPMPLAGRAKGLRMTLHTLKPSPFISIKLLTRAKRGATGNADENKKQCPN